MEISARCIWNIKQEISVIKSNLMGDGPNRSRRYFGNHRCSIQNPPFQNQESKMVLIWGIVNVTVIVIALLIA